MRNRIYLTTFRIIIFLLLVPEAGCRQEWSRVAISDATKKSSEGENSALCGSLPNGLSYYVESAPKATRTIEIRLVVNVGKQHETETQLENAHLVEHLAFEGTTAFPGDSLKSFFRNHGLMLGSDVTAYTADFHTVFQLTLTESSKFLIDDCIFILSQWASAVSFERNRVKGQIGTVISELKRNYQALNGRVFYAERSQVYGIRTGGVADLKRRIDWLSKVDPDSVSNFYKQWYRPGLMGIVIVGNINVMSVTGAIKRHFGRMEGAVPSTSNMPDRTKVLGTLRDSMRLVLIREPGFNGVRLQISFKTLAGSERSVDTMAIRRVVSEALSKRLSSVKSSTGSFVDAGVYDNIYESGIDVLKIGTSVSHWQDVESTFRSLLLELQRVRRYGFSESEIVDAKKIVAASADTSRTYPTQTVSACLDAFVSGKSICSPESHAAKMVAAIKKIDSVRIREYLARLVQDDKNLDFVFVASEAAPSEFSLDCLKKWYYAVSTGPIDRPVNRQRVSPHVNSVLCESNEISKVNDISSVKGLKIVDLKNGFRFFVMMDTSIIAPVDGEISLTAYTEGGYGRFSGNERLIAKALPVVVQSLGVGNLGGDELRNFQEVNKVAVNAFIGEYITTLNGSAVEAELDKMFSLTQAYLTAPNTDPSRFDKWRATAILDYQPHIDSEKIVLDSIFGWQGNESVGKMGRIISIPDYERIYKTMISTPKKFVFFLAGCRDFKRTKEAIVKYFGCLAVDTSSTDVLVPVFHKPVSGRLELHSGANLGTQTFMTFSAGHPFRYSFRAELTAEIAAEVLNARIFGRLRTKEGGAYTPSATLKFMNLGSRLADFSFQVAFQSGALSAERLSSIAREEFKIFIDGRLQEAEFHIAKGMVRSRYHNIADQKYILSKFIDLHRSSEDLDAFFRAQEIIDSIDLNDVLAFLSAFDKPTVHEVCILPEKKLISE